MPIYGASRRQNLVKQNAALPAHRGRSGLEIICIQQGVDWRSLVRRNYHFEISPNLMFLLTQPKPDVQLHAI